VLAMTISAMPTTTQMKTGFVSSKMPPGSERWREPPERSFRRKPHEWSGAG
jgi:hypothetical protein